MIDEALYHQRGIEAVKNEKTGEYEELKPILNQIEKEIEELQEKIGEDDETNKKGQGRQQSDKKQIIRSYKNQIKEKK